MNRKHQAHTHTASNKTVPSGTHDQRTVCACAPQGTRANTTSAARREARSQHSGCAGRSLQESRVGRAQHQSTLSGLLTCHTQRVSTTDHTNTTASQTTRSWRHCGAQGARSSDNKRAAQPYMCVSLDGTSPSALSQTLSPSEAALAKKTQLRASA